jgi:hypothetical protein
MRTKAGADQHYHEDCHTDRSHRLPHGPLPHPALRNDVRVGFEDQEQPLEVIPFFLGSDRFVVIDIVLVIPKEAHDLLHCFILGPSGDFRKLLVEPERGQFLAEVKVDNLG